MQKKISRKALTQQSGQFDGQSLGDQIDLLIRSNIRNWQGKEHLASKSSTPEEICMNLKDAFQANKVRNQMITQINHKIQNGPEFHFRNYHNY